MCIWAFTPPVPSLPLYNLTCPFLSIILEIVAAIAWDRQQWMNADLLLLMRTLEAGRPPACSSRFDKLRFAHCRSGRCWNLQPSFNISSIDFFPEGCFCLHNYWIEFKQGCSSIRPRVNVDFGCKRNNTKNRPWLLFSLRMLGHYNINAGIAKGVNLF